MSAAASVLVLRILLCSMVSSIVVLGQPELRGASGAASAAAAPSPPSSGLPLADENLWHAPDAVAGFRHVIWTSSAAKYKLPYMVWFGASGRFAWEAPFKDHVAQEKRARAERGEGMYLTAPRKTVRPNGFWEVHYFGSNRFTPDASNSTNCCCEYLGGDGRSGSFVLADYFVKKVPNSTHLPMWDVCAPYVRDCPVDNATARAVLGEPFIEIYRDVLATSQGGADASMNVHGGAGDVGAGAGVEGVNGVANGGFLRQLLLLSVSCLAGSSVDVLLKSVSRLWAAQRRAVSCEECPYMRVDV